MFVLLRPGKLCGGDLPQVCSGVDGHHAVCGQSAQGWQEVSAHTHTHTCTHVCMHPTRTHLFSVAKVGRAQGAVCCHVQAFETSVAL